MKNHTLRTHVDGIKWIRDYLPDVSDAGKYLIGYIVGFLTAVPFVSWLYSMYVGVMA